MNNESIIIFCMFCQCYCWTLYPERGRKPHSLLAESGFDLPIVGLFTPRGDGNTLEVFQLERSPNCWTLHPPERGRKPAGYRT